MEATERSKERRPPRGARRGGGGATSGAEMGLTFAHALKSKVPRLRHGRLGVKLQKGRKERATVVRQRLALSPYFSEEAALSRWCPLMSTLGLDVHIVVVTLSICTFLPPLAPSAGFVSRASRTTTATRKKPAARRITIAG